MGRPTIPEAEKLLSWAEEKNPGPWGDHSRAVARAASKIAAHCGMDGDHAYVLGLLHDIGRYKGVTAMQHILDGYELLQEKDYPDEAQICITHSFPLQDFHAYSGVDDCDDHGRRKVMAILEKAVYTKEDTLIQLCDALALPSGICLMEKRLVDVALRHGINEMTGLKWRKLFSIFEEFQGRMGVPLYSLFPEVKENTFEG